MLLFVEHQTSQPLPKAEGYDEGSQYPGRQVNGIQMLQVSVPRHRADVTEQDSSPSPSFCY